MKNRKKMMLKNYIRYIFRKFSFFFFEIEKLLIFGMCFRSTSHIKLIFLKKFTIKNLLEKKNAHTNIHRQPIFCVFLLGENKFFIERKKKCCKMCVKLYFLVHLLDQNPHLIFNKIKNQIKFTFN